MVTSRPDEEIPELPATGWAVLGLLSFGEELSGYDLKQWADYGLVFFYWSPSYSQIYGHLKRLESLGYAVSRTTNGKDDRHKRVYSITDSGSAALQKWVADAPVDPPVLKHGVMLRVWAGHLAEPSRLRALVDEHLDNTEQMREQAEARSLEAEEDPAWDHQTMVLRWAERYYAAQRELGNDLLTELDRLAGERDRSPRRSRRR